jgi:methyltransferase (TIGR00027 family)
MLERKMGKKNRLHRWLHLRDHKKKHGLRRTIERKSSTTAAFTCVSRAFAAREPDEYFRGPDTISEIFLPPVAKAVIGLSFLRGLVRKYVIPKGIYEYVLARTNVFDEAFQQVLEEQFPQIVLLGAGFDTRSWRFDRKNSGTIIFELDMPTTQEAKYKILKKKHVALPRNLVIVPIDFNREDVADVLQKAGYQEQKKTLFLWEGVTMYLTAEAVDRTLEFIRKSSAPGSRVVFDYIYASVLRQENTRYGEHEIFKTVSEAGEGWTFGLEEGSSETFLSQRGFKLLVEYPPALLEEKYLTADDGTLYGRVNGTHCIMLAETLLKKGV